MRLCLCLYIYICIEQKVIPNGLKIELEPSIGNHDEQFLSKWSERMQEFSLTLMKDIVEYCDKTTTKASEEIHTMQKEIDESFDDKKIMKETITTNKTTRLKNLKGQAKEIQFLKI